MVSFKGTRGEWLVVGQVALMLLVFLGPTEWNGWPPWEFPLRESAMYVGAGLILAGGALFLTSLKVLGPNLTPLPSPKADATLVTTGPYRLVRHPIYAGGLLVAFGYAIMLRSWLTIGYSTLMLLFLDFKSRREERWLSDRFPDYPDYQRRVRKLIPFVY